MNNSLKKLIEDSIIEALGEQGNSPPIFITQPKKREWGDLSTNLPFSLSRKTGESISKIGERLVSSLKKKNFLSRVEFIPPGFLNFFISSQYLVRTLKNVLLQRENFASFSYGKGKKVHIDFVSANPTGPLHIGHARGAAIGDSLANILSKVGYKVEREYYICDVGGQIERLSRSVWVRLQELEGKRAFFPEDGYKGDYVIEIARKAKKDLKEELSTEKKEERLLDLLGKFTVKEILKEIKKDLEDFGVKYDSWFAESTLYENREIFKTIDELQKRGYTYEKDGALWFKASLFLKEEKDRVLKRKNGEYTYFARDISYHQNKLSRGFDRMINVWGQDHIGYAPFLKVAVENLDPFHRSPEIIIYQFVTLMRGKEKISASTREGKFISLREVLNEIGKDVARFFFVSCNADTHLKFDLELAKKQSAENPVFYIQYAHARICSIFKKAKKEGIKLEDPEKIRLTSLGEPEEIKIMKKICLYPDVVKEAAESLEPHHLVGYAEELAALFHQFYTKHRVISDDKILTLARLCLVEAVRIVIEDTLTLLGISAPQMM